MRALHLHNITALTAMFFCQAVSAQSNTFTTGQIDSLVSIINSTCIIGGIDDGIIKNPETTETIGGFSDWYFTDSSRRQLLKVVNEESTYSYDFTYYYFFDDKLLYLFFKRGEPQADTIRPTSTGKYYFQNNKLIYKDDKTNFSFDKSFYLKRAKDYLKNPLTWRKIAR